MRLVTFLQSLAERLVLCRLPHSRQGACQSRQLDCLCASLCAVQSPECLVRRVWLKRHMIIWR